LKVQSNNTVAEKIEQIRALEDVLPAVLVVHSFPEFKVEYMSERGLRLLGVTLDEIKELGSDYNTRFFNPEDAKEYVPKIAGLLERNKPDEMVTFFQQVRSCPEQEWSWYLSSIKIIMWDANGGPSLTLTMAVPIDSTNHVTAKVERLLQERNFLRENHRLFACLTKREKEILRLIALGVNSSDIASQLHISESTASTHRKNIKRKLNLQSTYDITRFAQAFDLI
jgi:DNA-binding CsgD family transcriptional regulator